LLFCFYTVSKQTCDAIAAMRRKIQRINKKKVVYLDEVQCRINEAENFTIVLPGEKEYVIATDTTSYAERYDMIALCNGEQTFPPVIYTPKDRAARGVKGITKRMLEEAVDSVLAQAVGAIDDYPLYLVLDRACIHKDDIIQVFHDRGVQDIKYIWKMPTQAAKRMSPLDNSLFHYWKEKVRKHAPLSSRNIVNAMSNEWNRIPKSKIRSQYRKCLLMQRQNVYEDCPAPSSHRHH
jgi:hypothetical protein